MARIIGNPNSPHVYGALTEAFPPFSGDGMGLRRPPVAPFPNSAANLTFYKM